MSNSKSGIYKITNTVNQKFYIGSTKDFFKRRWYQHKNTLKRGIHRNPYLQKAWDKYGEDCFTFSVLEKEIKYENLHEREQYWIDLTNCTKRSIGYNICKNATKPNPPLKEKGYLVTFPNGLALHVENLTEFAQAWPEYRLDPRGLSSCARGEIPHTKSFKCMRAKEEDRVYYVKPEDKRLKSYVLFDPEGNRYETNNLSEFCREHDLEQYRTGLIGCVTGKNTHSNGWQCYYADKAPESRIEQEELEIERGYRNRYFIIDPDYNTYTTNNIEDFSKEHGLDSHCMRIAANPNEISQRHKNWQCYVDDENLNKEEIIENLKYFYLENPQTKEKSFLPATQLKNWCKSKNLIYENLLRTSKKNTQDLNKYHMVDGWYSTRLKSNELNNFTAPTPPESVYEEKGYIITHPDGQVEEVQNLSQFAEKHNLGISSLGDCAYGKQEHHKGYKVSYKDPKKRKIWSPKEDPKVKEYILFDPEGNKFEVKNLRQWLVERGLEKMYTGLVQCATKPTSYQCKKWQCFYKQNAPEKRLTLQELKEFKRITK